MQIDLTGKHAFVGGASKGIGFACAAMLAEAGANVTIMARNEDTLKKAVEKLPKPNQGQQHFSLSIDNDKPDEMLEKVKAHAEKHQISCQILINNSGGPSGGLIKDATIEEFELAYKRHLVCNHLMAQWALPQMKKSNYGRIINIISTSVKAPLPNLGVSNTTRGAVASWAKTLANEVAIDGITVNNILPGATETERLSSILENKANKTGKDIPEVAKMMAAQIPMNRFGKAEELAALAVFLASPMASYITGTSIPVDGGRTDCL